MGKSIIEELFKGNIRPCEKRAPLSSKRKELEERIQSERDCLLRNMTDEDGNRFKALEIMYTEATEDDEAYAFTQGFILGARIISAIFESGDEVIKEWLEKEG